MWVKFTERKPKDGIRIITRCRPWDKIGSAFEDWRSWKNGYLTIIPSITHWWDGVFDFNLAVDAWPHKNRKRITRLIDYNNGTSTTSSPTQSRATKKAG